MEADGDVCEVLAMLLIGLKKVFCDMSTFARILSKDRFILVGG